MRIYVLHYCTAPTYRKVYMTTVQASDKRGAKLALLQKVGKKKKIQVLSISAAE